MDIACPNCAATYRVPEALIAQGKPLRCAACGETWVPQIPAAPAGDEEAAAPAPKAEAPPAETAPEVPPEPGPSEREAAAPDAPPAEPVASPPPPRPIPPVTPPPLNPPVLQRRPSPGRGSAVALRLAWGASIATLLLVLAGLVLYGDAIATAWPPFARVTALLGG